ncbi:MAG: glycosyltransferase family 2 protein [Bacteroidota bacterium]
MIYVILPAYNEEKSFESLFDKIKHYFEEEYPSDYHIIVCNDGSKDRSAEILDGYKDSLPLTILTHKINRGLGETMRDLFEYVSEISDPSDIIIRMDCDDTHEPQFIKGLIEKINEGNDVVIASRFVEGGSGGEGLNFFRTFISNGAQLFMRIFFPIKGLKEYSSGFRAYRASSVKFAVEQFGNSFIQLKGLGFTCTLEKIVKFKILNAKFAEAPFVLKYDQKVSESKMVSSITTFGYLTLAVLYHWPWGGWKSQYKNKAKLH